eukprot:TRINITY_DN3276_c0_g1_i2.p1 TRINITY_DN3276_c0_g1~~TRINITY_DN3276_c0_g1_i2.p1  ORF type:complete len:230 (+),score=68.27 TRINITY_DN3276_c0_g1_i2:970-1659(+)
MAEEAAAAATAQKSIHKKVYLVNCGCFNPPHYLHLRIMELARDYCLSLGADVVGGCISPTNDAYVKKGLLSSDHRLAMCKIAVKDSAWMTCSDFELQFKEYCHTVTVLRHHKEQRSTPGNEVIPMLVCGADLLDSFNRPGCWNEDHMHEILGNYGVLCIERPGSDVSRFENYPILKAHWNNVHIVRTDAANELSSTVVRNNAAAGRSNKYLICDELIAYIAEHKLYTFQ